MRELTQFERAMLRQLRAKGVGSLLDDFANDYPLLRELSDKPEKWLEPNGKGTVRITDQQ